MKARTFFVGACLAAAAWPGLAAFFAPRASAQDMAAPAAGARSSIEWPARFRGRPLTRLAATPVEARFAVDGANEVLIARHVTRATRMLHPAADCFRAAGYAVASARAVVDADGARWNCFVAARDGARLRVCERIHDAKGGAWTDVAAWYWTALAGGGPWWALTAVTLSLQGGRCE